MTKSRISKLTHFVYFALDSWEDYLLKGAFESKIAYVSDLCLYQM